MIDASQVSMYEMHKLGIIRYEKNIFVVASENPNPGGGGDEGPELDI